ncbi:MAG: oxidoreductase [Promethearchaeota archaeon]
MELELRNRFIFTPIKLGYSDGSGRVNEKHLNFYRVRSRYTGAVILELFYIAPYLKEVSTQLGIDDDNKIKGLWSLTDVIHSNGSKVIAHLNHPSRMANPQIQRNRFYSSTDKPCPIVNEKPERLNKEEIEEVNDLFVNAVRCAEVAAELIKENDVIIVEMFDELARGIEMIEKKIILNLFKDYNVTICLNSKITKVEESGKIYLNVELEPEFKGVDIIVVATKMKSFDVLERELEGRIPVYKKVGDSLKVGKAQDAIHSAFEVVREL